MNRRLNNLAARLKDRPEMTIEYFIPDERKAGGVNVTLTGSVKKILSSEHLIVMDNGQLIRIADILSLKGKNIEE